MKKNWFTTLIVAVTLAGGVTYYFGVLGPNTSVDETSFGKPLAVIRNLNREVRHKYPGDFFWRTSNEGQKLFNGSEIFVGSQSSTVLFFSGSRRARLSENTLLRISEDNTDKNNLILTLNDGSFNIRSFPTDQSSVVLRVDEGGLKIRPGYKYDLYVKKKEKALGLSLASGHLQMDGVAEKTELQQGESVIVRNRNPLSQRGSDGPNKVELYIDQSIDPSIRLINPQEKQIVYKSDRAQTFRWESHSTSDRQVLEYSSHPDFFDNLTKIDVTNQKLYPIPSQKMQGDIFWRIVTYKEGVPQFSSPSYFKVANLQPIHLKELKVSFLERGKWQLEATVDSTDTNARYEFQVSKSDTFTEPYDAFVGPAPFRSLLDQSGQFFVRVRRLYNNDLLSDWSELKTLQVRPPISAPTLSLASNKEQTQGAVTAEVTWSADAYSENFLLRTSPDADFKSSKIIRLPKDKLEYRITENLNKNLYVAVQAESVEGEVSPLSNVVILKPSAAALKSLATNASDAQKAQAVLKLLTPPNNAVAYVGKPVRFEWTGTAAALEISPVAGFSQNVEKFKTVGLSSFEITRKNAGPLYWRLIKTNGQRSDFRHLSVVPMTDINLEEASLRFIERGRWEVFAKVRNARAAETFQLELSRSEDFKTLVASYKGTLNKGIPVSEPGRYYLRAQKLLADKPASGWSNTATADVRPPLQAPELLKEKEELVSPILVRVTVQWKPVPHAKDYLIEMSDTPGFGSKKLKIAVNDEQYDIEHSTRDPSFVRVIARSAEGEISPASEVFKVKGVLPGPSVDRYEIAFGNIEDKKDSDKLHILWNHRKNAKKYFLEVGRREDLKDAKRLETKNIEFFMPVTQEGWYYFRLIPSSESTEFFDTPSQVYAVEYRKQEDLQPAALEAPNKGKRFKRGDAIRFAWGQILGAAWYELELSQNTDFTGSTVYKVEARDYYLKQGLDNGRWYFRIRGRSSSQSSPWSESSFIEIN